MRIRECVRKILCAAASLALAAGPALAEEVSLTEMSLALGNSEVRYPAADGITDETLQQVAGAKGADMGWQEMMELDGKVIGTSDGGKISFRAGDYGGNL